MGLYCPVMQLGLYYSVFIDCACYELVDWQHTTVPSKIHIFIAILN